MNYDYLHFECICVLHRIWQGYKFLKLMFGVRVLG